MIGGHPSRGSHAAGDENAAARSTADWLIDSDAVEDSRPTFMAAEMIDPTCTVHDIGFRDDRSWNAYRIFGGPRMIHRRFDRHAVAEIGPADVVAFAAGDETQPVVRGGPDLDDWWLLP